MTAGDSPSLIDVRGRDGVEDLIASAFLESDFTPQERAIPCGLVHRDTTFFRLEEYTNVGRKRMGDWTCGTALNVVQLIGCLCVGSSSYITELRYLRRLQSGVTAFHTKPKYI